MIWCAGVTKQAAYHHVLCACIPMLSPYALPAVARRIEARLRQIVEDVHLLPDVQRLRRTISLTSHSQVGRVFAEKDCSCIMMR